MNKAPQTLPANKFRNIYSIDELQVDTLNKKEKANLVNKTEMEAQCTNKKTFQLTENEQQLGELTYQNLLYLKAQIKLSDTECYEAKPVGFFGTSIAITANEEKIAKLKMNWRGQILISFKNGQEFMLKGKGLLQDKYIIENEAGEKLLQFDPKFNWRQFNYNYTITNNQQPQNILLVLLGVYAANYFIASMSGAVGGIG